MTKELEAPCKDCKDRKLNCHSSCKKYLDYQVKNEERKAIERNSKVDTSHGWAFTHKRKRKT